jgi:hypothetical protein
VRVDRRLLGLAVLAPVSALAAGVFPAVAPVASVVIAAASVGWALRGGWLGWCRAIGPGVVVIAAAAPEVLVPYVASALAGPLVRGTLSRGQSPGRATLRGAAPAVALAIGAAASGFQPVPEDLGPRLAALIDEAARQGDLAAERLAEMRESSEAAIRLVRRTWVAAESIWIWASLALGYAWARRLVPGFPGFGPFSRLDVPDAAVWALIAGLAAMLAGGQGTLGVVGSNLVAATGFAFLLRGFAIECFWMDRAALGRAARFGLFAGGVVLFLPVFLIVAAGFGLFDSWFDFRRIRDPEPGSHPFSFLRGSSRDDANEKE